MGVFGTAVWCAAANADDCLNYAQYLRWLGSVSTAHFAHAVAVSGNYAYVPVRLSGGPTRPTCSWSEKIQRTWRSWSACWES